MHVVPTFAFDYGNIYCEIDVTPLVASNYLSLTE